MSCGSAIFKLKWFVYIPPNYVCSFTKCMDPDQIGSEELVFASARVGCGADVAAQGCRTPFASPNGEQRGGFWASGLGGVLVVNGAEREQALVAVVGLRGGGHGDDAADAARLVLIDSLFYFGYLHL
jgi:hypothetical protein